MTIIIITNNTLIIYIFLVGVMVDVLTKFRLQNASNLLKLEWRCPGSVAAMTVHPSIPESNNWPQIRVPCQTKIDGLYSITYKL